MNNIINRFINFVHFYTEVEMEEGCWVRYCGNRPVAALGEGGWVTL